MQVYVNNTNKPQHAYVSVWSHIYQHTVTIPHLVLPGFVQCIEHLMRQQKRDCSLLPVQLVLSLQGMPLKMRFFLVDIKIGY